jgi:hypothetical protein
MTIIITLTDDEIRRCEDFARETADRYGGDGINNIHGAADRCRGKNFRHGSTAARLAALSTSTPVSWVAGTSTTAMYTASSFASANCRRRCTR